MVGCARASRQVSRRLADGDRQRHRCSGTLLRSCSHCWSCWLVGARGAVAGARQRRRDAAGRGSPIALTAGAVPSPPSRRRPSCCIVSGCSRWSCSASVGLVVSLIFVLFLRAGPRADPAAGRGRDRLLMLLALHFLPQESPRRAPRAAGSWRDATGGGRGRPRRGGARVGRADPPVQPDLAATTSSMRCPAAAAPTSSTSSWSTSAASTRSARSPCWASRRWRSSRCSRGFRRAATAAGLATAAVAADRHPLMLRRLTRVAAAAGAAGVGVPVPARPQPAGRRLHRRARHRRSR